MAKVKVLIDSLEHDGKRCKPGAVIELDDPFQLLELGAVELVREPKKPDETKK